MLTTPQPPRGPSAQPSAHGRDDRRLAVRFLAAILLGGPLTALVWLALPHAAGASETGIAVVAAASAVVGLGVLGGSMDRRSEPWLAAAVAAATLLTTALVFFSGAHVATLGFFWTVPYAFWALPRRFAVAQAALVAGSLVVLLLAHDAPGAGAGLHAWSAGDAFVAVASLLIVGGLVAVLAERLSESDRRFRRGFEDSRVAAALVALDGAFIEVNAAMCALVARSEAELLRLTVDDVEHLDDVPGTREEARRALRGEHAGFARRARYVRADGAVVWGELQASLVRDDDGRPRYWSCQVQDVTARRQAEQEREEALAVARRRAAAQEAVAALGQAALKSGQVERLMALAVEEVARVLEVDVAGVVELAGDGRTLRAVAAHGLRDDRPPEARVVDSGRRSQAGYTLLTGGPVVAEDFARETRFELSGPMRDAGLASGLSVPIDGPHGPFGVLMANACTARTFTAGEISFLMSVANVLGTASQRRAAEQDAVFRALHDPLTGLPNRSLLLDRVRDALTNVGRDGAVLAVVLLDVDRFKLLNDGLGHEAGDELLVALARRLGEAMRDTGTVGRLGGDEFVVVGEGVAPGSGPVELARRVEDALIAPFSLRSGEHFVSASVGVAVATSGGETAEQLLREADAAMYRAKEEGRGHFELFDEAMRARAVGRLHTEADLRRAVEREQLSLVFQPIVELADERVVAVEALLRWTHPVRGPVPREEFITLAEETGLILPIGRWVLDRACAQLAAWHRAGLTAVPLEMRVNVSARQLGSRHLAADVRSALDAHGVDPALLGLELTETMLIREAEDPVARLRELSELGVRLVLDDFGTGYSSLSYLRRLPLDAMKIDRSFIEQIEGDEQSALILSSTAQMGRGLGLTVVAEGVETPAQVALVRELGCDHAQGYHFARPLSAADLEAWIGAPVGPA